jgi:hypothetical protein
MTKTTTKILTFFLVVGISANCHGHGHPIVANVADGKFVVSGGLRLSRGLAKWGFDYDEDAYLDVAPGNTLGSTLPGFQINGVEAGSQIMLEVLSRPDFTQVETPNRWLWFWDKETQQISVAPDATQVQLDSQRGFPDIWISQFAEPSAMSSMQLLEPKSSEIGSHQHPILYRLTNSPPAAFGAYGFFARLTSPNYASSEPFLIALNYSLSSEEYDMASRQINAAAMLPGDFDRNDVVDGADFLAWQREFGSATELSADGSLNKVVDADDLAIWKQNFGRIWPVAGATTPIPEPATAILLAWSILALAKNRGRK